ncbi:MAG: hypothetical protein BWY72_00989 [Bacteroidetes bacterium ADurb.Bin416]|nr:MAG: hypothetical protein BWY72_00989 [Bacteroidetes bacterium ADurb.Bin416]
MLHAVFLLVAAGQFVLLDAAFQVVVHVGTHHQTVLGLAIHGLGIDVVAICLVLHQPAVVPEAVEIFHGFGIDLFLVFILTHGEINLRLDDVVERFFVITGLCPGFFTVEHVVGT